MQLVTLGNTGLRVSRLCLGTMTFGEDWGPRGANKETSAKIFDAFVEAGGNFIDTANRYTEGSSERFLGEFMQNQRDRFVLATKYTLLEDKSHANGSGNNKKNLRQTVENSLKRLNTDYLDLLWVHAWDYSTSIENLMLSLNDLVRSGKVLHIGVSDTPAWVVAKANTLAEANGWHKFEALQVEYSLIQRTVEMELLPMARHFGMSITPWSPLGAGVLSGKYNQGIADGGRLTASSLKINEFNISVAKKVAELAEQKGCSSSQLALAWLLSKGTDVVPIVGSKKLEQIQDNLKAVDVQLSAEDLAQLDACSDYPKIFPHDFLQLDTVQDIVYGGQQKRLVQHNRKKLGGI